MGGNEVRVLGLAGRMGAGKDRVADYLTTEYRTVKRFAFADALKAEAANLFGVDTDTKPYPEHVRWLLQEWGVRQRDQEGVDYWSKQTALEIQAEEEAGALLVVTDVRFQNEMNTIRNLGGRVAFVYAPPEIRAKRLGVTRRELHAASMHPSEADIQPDECDYLIENVIENWSPLIPGTLWQWLGQGAEPLV